MISSIFSEKSQIIIQTPYYNKKKNIINQKLYILW